MLLVSALTSSPYYDALTDNLSAQKLMQDQVLATMARELAEMLRRDATIDWQSKENVRRNSASGSRQCSNATNTHPTARNLPSKSCSAKQRPWGKN